MTLTVFYQILNRKKKCICCWKLKEFMFSEALVFKMIGWWCVLVFHSFTLVRSRLALVQTHIDAFGIEMWRTLDKDKVTNIQHNEICTWVTRLQPGPAQPIRRLCSCSGLHNQQGAPETGSNTIKVMKKLTNHLTCLCIKRESSLLPKMPWFYEGP